jgi:hypothetical protein
VLPLPPSHESLQLDLQLSRFRNNCGGVHRAGPHRFTAAHVGRGAGPAPRFGRLRPRADLHHRLRIRTGRTGRLDLPATDSRPRSRPCGWTAAPWRSAGRWRRPWAGLLRLAMLTGWLLVGGNACIDETDGAGMNIMDIDIRQSTRASCGRTFFRLSGCLPLHIQMFMIPFTDLEFHT